MNQDELDEIERVGEEVFAPTVETKFDSVVQDLDETEKDNAIFVANEKAPDQMAESLSLSKQLGVGYDFIDKNKDSLKRFAKQKELSNKLDEIKKTAPRTHDFLLSPENLALSQDEIDELAKLELNINNQSATMQVLNSLDVTAYQTLGMFAKVPAAVWTAYSVPRNIVVKALGFDEVSSTSDVMMKLSEPFDERAAYHRQFTPTANLDFIDELKKGNLGRAAGAAGLQVLQNSGTTAAILGASMVSGGAATGALVGVGAGSGAQHAKEAEEKGASPLQAGVAGVASGFFEAAFEKLELGIFNKMESSLLELFKRPLLETEKKQIALQATKTILGAMGKEALTEGATEASTKFTDYTVGVDPNLSLADFTKETLRAGILGGLSAGALQGPVAVTSSFARATEVKRAVKQNEIILQLAEDAKNSKLLERSPESYADRLDRLLSGSIENIVIPKTAVDALFQDSDKGPSEVIKELGIEKEYAESEKTGADIVMKTSELMARAGKTDMIPKLAPYMKFEGAQASLNEAKANETEDLEVLKQLDKEALEAKQPSIDSQVSEIQKQVKSQLEDMGYPAVEATKNAIAFAQSYKADAIKMQRQPMELFKEFPIGVTSEGIKVGDEVFFQTRQNELGFYSRLEQTISDKMSNTQDVGSLKAMLKDIKPEEMKWSGVEEFLNGKEKVSKTELLDYLRANQIEIKEITKTEDTTYSQWKLPGGENYREVLLTLPGSTETYKSSHFKDTPNILAHTRLQDFTDTDGKKTLLVEEIQSDWHQGGRKKGYKEDLAAEFTPLTESSITEVFDKDSFWSFTFKLSDGKEVDQKVYKQEWDSKQKKKVDAGLTLDSAKQLALSKINEEELRHANYIKERKEAEMVPDAPFKKTWHEFVFKRIARMAAEQGYDKIAWTTGEQQSERYDLSKQIDEIEYQPPTDGKTDFDKKYVIRAKKRDQILIDEAVDKESLADLVGKDIAQKIIDGEGKEKKLRNSKNSLFSLSGLDLKVGGEGMKGFYDKILVDYANKFGKKFGVRVEDISVKSEGKPTQYADFDAYVKAKESGIKVHSIEVTPQMRQSIMKEGQPLFQGDKQGAFNPETFMIHLLKSKDRSTFMHELGHGRLFQLKRYIDAGIATDAMKKDMEEVLKYLGAESFETLTTEQQEVFARTVEAYFMKGEVPHKGLRRFFSDLKAWFLETYSKFFEAAKSQLIKQGADQSSESFQSELEDLAIEKFVGQKVTPEIKDVVTRIFVADDLISKNQSEQMFKDPAMLDVLSESEIYEYLNAAEWARQDAENDLRAKLMKDVITKQKSSYREKYNEIYSQKLADAKELQVFKAIELIKTQYKLDASLVKSQYNMSLNDLPRGLTSKEAGSFEPDMVAAMVGYNSAQEMLADISTNKKGVEDFADKQALAEMEKLYPELLKSPELSREAVKSAYNEQLSKLKQKELEILATKDFKTTKKLSARLIARLPRMGEIVEQAKGIIDKKTLAELKPYKYQQAEKRYAKEAAKKFVAGDIDGSFEAKRFEYLNFELYRESLRRKDEISKELKFFKKLYKIDEVLAKGRDTDLINAARAVLAEYGITRADKSATEWLSKMKAYDVGRYNSLQVLIGAATSEANQIDNISLEKFDQLTQAVHALWDLSKIEHEYNSDNQTLQVQDVVNQLSVYLEALTPTQAKGIDHKVTEIDKLKTMLLGIKGSLTRLEPYFKALGEPFHKLVFSKIIDAQTRMQERQAKQIEKFVELLKPIGSTLNVKEKYFSKELNYNFTGLQEVLGALLHRGNESNFAKLVVGNQWGTVDENGNLDASRFIAFENRLIEEGVLKKEHYDFLQNVWDLLEDQKADAQKAHKKMYGYYFNEITSKEFTNKFGTYRGGYFPAIADPYKVSKASQYKEADDLLNVNNNFMMPSTNKGFTKERAENYFAPLIMDLNQAPNHLKSVSTLIELGPEVKEVLRLFLHPEIQTKFDAIDKGAINEMIIPWLQRVAQQRLPITGTGVAWRNLDRFATFLRTGTGLQTMTFNFINAMQNFSQVPSVLSRADLKSFIHSLGVLIVHPVESTELIKSKSDFMKNRQGSLVMEAYDTLNDLLENPSQAENGVMFIKKHGRFMSEFTQSLVESIAWLSGYRQALKDGKSEAEAVKQGDSTVRLTQGGFTMAEVSRFETGSPVMRLFTMFYSFFNAVLNNWVGGSTEVYRKLGLKKGASHLGFLALVCLTVPAILNDSLLLALGGDDFDKDNDGLTDDILSLVFGSQLNMGIAMLPLGQVGKTAINAFNDKAYDDKISLSPALGMVERSLQAPASLYKAIEGEGSPKKAVTDVLTLLGMVTKLPVAPLAKPINYLIDVNEGNVKPTGPIDFSRGLVTGKGNRQ